MERAIPVAPDFKRSAGYPAADFCGPDGCPSRQGEGLPGRTGGQGMDQGMDQGQAVDRRRRQSQRFKKPSVKSKHLTPLEPLEKIFRDRNEQILFAYLFGSRAKGTDSVGSDIDIAVYLNPRRYAQFFDIKTELYLEISRCLNVNAIDIVILNQCRNIMLLDSITRHGKVLYESDSDARLNFEQRALHIAIDFKTQRKRIMGV
jgi:uncharacterized protein